MCGIIIIIGYIRGGTTISHRYATRGVGIRYAVGIPIIPILTIIDETASKGKTSIYFPRMSGDVVRGGGFEADDSDDGQ